MSGKRFDLLPLGQIILERIGNLIRQIQNDFLAAFAGDDKGVLLKIEIVDVQPDAFADADARAQKQRQHRQIALFGHIVIFLVGLGQRLSVFGQVQDSGNLVDVQTDDGVLVELRKRHKRGSIAFNQPVGKQILVECAKGSIFPLDAVFVIGDLLGSDLAVFQRFVFDVERQEARIALQVLLGYFADIVNGEFGNRLAGELRKLLREILKEELEIVRVAQPRERTGLLLNGHEVIRADFRKLFQELTQALGAIQAGLIVIVVGHMRTSLL